jgi:hypothetical protein
LPKAIDEVVLRALSSDVETRPETARKLASELTRIIEPADPDQVAEWVRETAGEALAERRARVREIESQRSEDTDAEVVITRPKKGADPYGITLPAAANPTPSPSVQALSLPSLPLPETVPERRRSAWPLLALLGVAAVMGSSVYAFISLRKDLDSGLDPAAVASEEQPVERVAPSATATPADSSLLSSSPLPSSWPTTKPRATTGSRTKTTTKKQRPAHCTPPYVVLGDGRRVTKLGCD